MPRMQHRTGASLRRGAQGWIGNDPVMASHDPVMVDSSQTFLSLRLDTPRTIVRMGTTDDVPSIIGYYSQNREHLRPFDPERPPFFYEERFWRIQVRQSVDDFAADRCLRLFVFLQSAPDRVIGNIGFSNF